MKPFTNSYDQNHKDFACVRDLLGPLYLANRRFDDPLKRKLEEDLYMIQRDRFISTDSKCVVRKFHRSTID